MAAVWTPISRWFSSFKKKKEADTFPVDEIGSEAPIRTRAEDRLRRAEYADRIATVLSQLSPREGRVFAIRGGWGFGKSSLKNLITEQLKIRDGGASWLEFNPWQCLAAGRTACGSTVGSVKMLEPGPEGVATHPCFTGQDIHIVSIAYEGRRIGRIILGPYLPAATTEVPATFVALDPNLDLERARRSLIKVPRAKAETVVRIAKHLQATLDLILFSGHKTLLTSQMHLASVRESFRELTETTIASLQSTGISSGQHICITRNIDQRPVRHDPLGRRNGQLAVFEHLQVYLQFGQAIGIGPKRMYPAFHQMLNISFLLLEMLRAQEQPFCPHTLIFSYMANIRWHCKFQNARRMTA